MILTGKYPLPCIIPHCLFTVIYTSCLFSCSTALYAHLLTALYAHLSFICVALRGGNTTPSFVADALLSSVSRLQVYARDC
jgi:hypothetical protein